MTETHITQERLKELFHYDPLTGLFTNLTTRGRCLPGTVISIATNKTTNKYPRMTIDYKSYFQHRIIFLYMTGSMPNQVDHIDHDTSNNKWSNLRNTTHSVNNKNATKNHRNNSGVMGVRWRKKDFIWESRIGFNRKLIHLGTTDDYFEAVCRRKSAEVKHGFHKNHGK